MTKIKILQVSATNKKKDGSVMPGNTLRVGLKTTKANGEEIWLNGIVEKDAMTFEAGQEVELEIEETQYGMQFKAPTIASIINSLDNRLRKLEMMVKNAPQVQNKPVIDLSQPQAEDLPENQPNF
jgi:hypothetical protein